MQRFAANTQIKLLFYLLLVVSTLYFVQDRYGVFQFEDNSAEEIEEEEKPAQLSIETAQGERYKVSVEISDSEFERSLGLMNRDSLDTNAGMLFLFDNDSLSGFWMKDVKISLDMIFADSEGEIVYIEKEAQPCVDVPCKIYNPGVPYRYVLEVNGGWTDEKGIEIGDKLNLQGITSDS